MTQTGFNYSPTPTPERTGIRVKTPEWKLGGRRVPQDIFYQAKKARQAGQRMFLITAGDLPGGVADPTTDNPCPNCQGFGRMALETVVGGPFEDVPFSGPRGKGITETYISAVVKDGKWYQVTRDYFACPVCSPVREIQL